MNPVPGSELPGYSRKSLRDKKIPAPRLRLCGLLVIVFVVISEQMENAVNHKIRQNQSREKCKKPLRLPIL